MRKLYGDEYPEAVACNGHRLPLSHETRFMRHYSGPKMSTSVSRFSDGFAHITLAELCSAWDSWEALERYDFAHSLMGLEAHEDLPEMLRFLLSHGSECEWAIAQMVARHLPQDKAFDRLVTLLAKTGSANNPGHRLDEASRGEEVLRNQLAQLCADIRFATKQPPPPPGPWGSC